MRLAQARKFYNKFGNRIPNDLSQVKSKTMEFSPKKRTKNTERKAKKEKSSKLL